MSKFSSPFMAKSPLNKNGDPDTYKVGEWLDQDKMAKNPDQFPAFYDSYSEVQEDEKGQFVTTLDDIGSAFETVQTDTYPVEYPAGAHDYDPEKEKANFKLRERETIGGTARDTVRPIKGIKFIKN